jgi:NADH:ubiquinone oxidoreductase subunit E
MIIYLGGIQVNTCDNKKINELKLFIEQYKDKPYFESHLIAVLHKAQELYGYLQKDVMDFIAEEMSIPTSVIWGVATFYHYFTLTPQGKHKISVCLGTACYVKGSEKILERIKELLKINIGQTTEDRLFTLQETRCVGACGLAPVVMIDDKVYGKVTPETIKGILDSYKK